MFYYSPWSWDMIVNFFLFLIYFIDYAITAVPFFIPFIPLHPVLPIPPSFFHLSSHLWVIHTSSLASPFPVLFLTSPCLFCTYALCFLFPVPFPPFSPHPIPTDSPPSDLHFCDSVPILVVCLAYFCFLGSVVDSCDFCHYIVHIF